jgi:hypothetical protein
MLPCFPPCTDTVGAAEEGTMLLETLCFAVVALAMAAPGLVVAVMSWQPSQAAPSDLRDGELKTRMG